MKITTVIVIVIVIGKMIIIIIIILTIHPSIYANDLFEKNINWATSTKPFLTFHGLWRDPTAACQICSLKIAG